MAIDTTPSMRIGGTTVTIENKGSRNKAVNPALLRAVATRVEQAYGPGYTVRLKSGGGHSASGTQRHTPVKGGGIAGDFSIETPDGRQLAGADLAPLADAWIGVEGSMGINHRPGNRGANWTHMDLVGGVNPAGRPFRRGEGPVWYYGSGNYKWSEEDRTARAIKSMGYPSVEAYQEAKGLDVDGVIGPQTNGAVLADLTGGRASGGLGVAAGAPVPDYSGDPFGVAASKRPQDAQGAIASLIAPSGGAAVPDMPTAAMGYAPNLSGIEPPAPPMPQVASNPAPLPTPPPQWVNGDFAQDTMVGGASPPMPRLRDQSVLDQQRADMLDEMLFGAGPHRGEYARGRPEGRWTGGGAPDASAVPTPTLSPLNPAVGGPADRRPTPPVPTLRPEGRWMSGAGGAPDAGSVPNPPPRGTLYAPAFPDVFGEQPQRVLADVPARFDMEAPAAMPDAPAAPRLPADGLASEPGKMTETERARIYANIEQFRREDAAGRASGADLQDARTKDDIAPPPPSPYDDWTREFDTPGPITMANERMGVFEGTPDPSTIAPPSRTPEVGNVNYSAPLPTQRLPQTQAAVSEPGMGLGPYGMTPPPSETGPFFDNANPGPTFTPPAPAGTSFNIPPSPFQGSTGEFFTPAPPMPMPQPSMMADRFNDAFSPGGGGQIMDLQTAFDRRNAPPTMNAQDGINSVFGAPPAQAMPPNLAIPFAEVPRPNFDFAGPAPAAAANITTPLPTPTISRQDFDARFAGGTVAPATPTPGVTPGVVSGTMPTPEGVDIRPAAQGGPPVVQRTAPPPSAQPARPAPRQTNVGAERQKQGAALRILGTILGGPLLGGAGGILGGGLGRTNAFTPFQGGPMINTGMGFFRSSGTAPNASGGQTQFAHGNVGNMQGTMWNRSTGGSVGYVTDPFTTAMIYSSSPMTF